MISTFYRFAKSLPSTAWNAFPTAFFRTKSQVLVPYTPPTALTRWDPNRAVTLVQPENKAMVVHQRHFATKKAETSIELPVTFTKEWLISFLKKYKGEQIDLIGKTEHSGTFRNVNLKRPLLQDIDRLRRMTQIRETRAPEIRLSGIRLSDTRMIEKLADMLDTANNYYSFTIKHRNENR